MNKKFILCFCAALFATHALHAEPVDSQSFYDDYKAFKEKLKQNMGLTYSGAASLFGQYGTPVPGGSHSVPLQQIYTANANWEAFQSEYGDGSFQIGFSKIIYGGQPADVLNQDVGAANPINHYTFSQNRFPRLSYTHRLPGKYDWISFTAGQFPIFMFDNNPYAANQQMDFNNFALTQGLADTYSMASLGAFVKLNPTEDWQFTFGIQDAHSPIKTHRIYASDIDEGKYVTFAEAKYTPTITDIGKSYVSLMLWNRQSSEIHKGESTGISLNLAQDFKDKWAVFAGVNANSGQTVPIKQSYLAGVVYKDPLKRNNPADRIGLAMTYSIINRNMLRGARSEETMTEAYWNYGLTEYFVISPDIQYYYKPGLNQNHENEFVSGLRATLLF